MDREAAELLIREIYQAVLGRNPGDKEFNEWVETVLAGRSASYILAAFRQSKEFQNLRKVKLRVAPGHYHSPIVDPATVQDYLNWEKARPLDDLKRTIPIDMKKMERLWRAWRPIIQQTDFQRAGEKSNRRFFLNNGNFPFGDAAILRAMIVHAKPRRIVEVGSGNSTACMLDTIDEFGLTTKITCIEPYPERLKALCKPDDYRRLSLLEEPLQRIPLDTFSDLGAGDILFIDSTHVLKTASDVHYELFYILPALKPGVLIHFHDCPFPFEYPDKWVLEDNWSWNEVYGVRAFLMYNASFEIRFWSGLFNREYKDDVRAVCAGLSQAPGSGLWMVKKNTSGVWRTIFRRRDGYRVSG